MTARAAGSLSRALVVTVLLGISFQVNALPLSPKWMKSSEDRKVSEPIPSGVLGDETGSAGGGVQALPTPERHAMPTPASLWLVSLGLAGIAAVRRKR